MAITSLGVGSGLDAEGIVTKLMALERQPLTLLQTRQTDFNNKLSAVGKIKSAIAALQSAASAMSTTSKLYSFKGVVADTTIASATTTSSASAGVYSLEVERLAGTHKLLSSASPDTSTGGTLTFEVGSTVGGVFTAKSGTSAVGVTVSAGATLSQVRDAINGSGANVTATIVNGASGEQLVVTSKYSGETGQIRITASAGLGSFSYDPVTATGGLTQKDAGQDAIVRIDGILIKDTTSNTVTDAITGVTLNLTKTNLGSPTQLSISNDTSNLTSKVEAFVKAFNELNTTAKDLTKYDATTKKAGVLNGDSMVSSVLGQLRDALYNVPAGASSDYQRLSDLGVSIQTDGSLKIDSTVLQSAVTTKWSAVATTVAAYGTTFDTLTTAMNGTDGIVTSRTDGINANIKTLGSRSDELSRRLEAVEKRYRAQFSALDALMGKMQTTSSYLSQQLASLRT
ncbi:MAG: flagellar filament capping protein FliD [Rhodocyclales bacterium]|nr:flagellar filament capping protein FliD [Rhodocyclales bacterium]